MSDNFDPALLEALEAARSRIPFYLSVFSQAWFWTLERKEQGDSHLLHLIAEIGVHEPTASLVGKFLYHPSGSLLTTREHLAAWLLLRAQDVGSKQALQDIHNYLRLSTVSGEIVVVLTALEVVEPQALADGVTLRPWSTIPPSSTKRELSSFSAGSPIATAALTTPFEWSRIPEQTDDPFVNAQPYFDALDRVHRALTCMQLMGTTGVQWFAQYVHTSTAAPFFMEGGQRTSISGTFSRQLWSADWTDVVATMQAQLDIHPDKKTLQLVAHRLASSLNDGDDPVDRFIDLGIAMEALFLGDGSQELLFRLRTRSARLVGADITERRRIDKTVAAFYVERSKAVHTGRINAEYPVASKLLADVSAIAGKGARRILASGAKPDWEAIILG